MKKWKKIVIFGIILLLVIAGVINHFLKRSYSAGDAGESFFNAVVLEITEDTVRVKPVDNENVSAQKQVVEAESVLINADIVAADGLPELKNGDKIRIVYNGESIENDPLRINIVFNVYLFDENGNIEP